MTNIVIIGQGAMGLLWYHHLANSTENPVNNTDNTPVKKVSLLASNQSQLSKDGLISTKYQFSAYPQGQSKVYPLRYCQPHDITTADIVILCLKSYHVIAAIKSIADKISPHCLVILAHNGMGTLEHTAELLPAEQVIMTLLTTHGCLRHSPLNITHTGLGQSDIGLLQGELSNAQQIQLTNLLNNALPTTNFHQNIAQKQWLKLAVNCVINPITAINNIENGEVNAQKFTQQIKTILTEIIQVNQAEMRSVEGAALVITELQTLIYNVAKATAKNCSSMRSDVLAARPTEVDYINGYIHRLGEKYNIATPENTRLWQQVKALE